MVLLWLELIVVRALEGLYLEGPEWDMLREIHQGNQKGNQEEPIAKAVRELWQVASKTVHSVEWSEDDGVLRFRGKIYVPWNLDLRRQVVLLCHDMKVAGHPGTLHSDAHDSNSGRSSQAFPTSSLETPRSSKVCSLRLWTSVCHSFHQRALPTTRNKVGVFYSLASPNRQTDGMCQPRVGPVPLAICK